ncbi:LOW QUALITY PROTEIN: hypothetical protein OSB04_002872 [Centaurea solstitialis]|uniref:DUF4218 domain-containing protein n=1 Tax=Centaurea solstitialis TaxID=347529 RepID=A0AA38U492_9ASTR|nr:LOW QUALITY PROTEIN: hypothetical protein OSB04_002872 [Centaurea solstitialis]
MHASILWTINDYPAYAMMSGWSTKGYKACPTCKEETPFVGIRSKIAYIGHRRFLEMDHEWRNKGSLFDGQKELRPPPKKYSGDEILEQLPHLHYRLQGNTRSLGRKRSPVELNWSKKSIIFELEYWKKLSLMHNMDCVGYFVKYGRQIERYNKARLDLADMKIRKKLHLYQEGNKWMKLHASYTLSVAERRQFCQLVKSVEFQTYQKTKISGLKSHDCHVLFQRLLPAAIRPLLNTEVQKVITELCLFFKQICSRTLNLNDLEKMQKEIIIILCKLETIFPPAFFYIMVHLCLHPNEAILGGPVHFRWMYPIERSMAVYKRYVRNRACPEGSIAEAYVVNEALTFCSMYFRGIETRFNRPERNDDRPVGPPFGKRTTLSLDPQLKRKAEWYILNNCTEIEDYINEHINELKRRGASNLQRQEEGEFPEWFKTQINQLCQSTPCEVSDKLYTLANKSSSTAFSYPGINVNGVKFVIHSRDQKLKTQNSGIMVPSVDGVNYYGVLEEILELSYMMDVASYFLSVNGLTPDELKKIQSSLVFMSKTNDDPFILASQAKLVYYLNDDKNGDNWRLVNTYIPRNVWDFLYRDVEETATSKLPILDNLRYDRDDVNPTEVYNVNDILRTTATQFVVDDDKDEENEVEYEEEEEKIYRMQALGSSTGKKNIRGTYYGAAIEKELAKRGPGVTRLEVLFNLTTGKAIDKYGNGLTTSQLDKFVFPHDDVIIKDSMDRNMQRYYSEWLYGMKQHWRGVGGETNNEAAKAHPYNNMDPTVWVKLCDHWCSESQQEKSGQPPSTIDTFEKLHRKQDGWFNKRWFEDEHQRVHMLPRSRSRHKKGFGSLPRLKAFGGKRARTSTSSSSTHQQEDIDRIVKEHRQLKEYTTAQHKYSMEQMQEMNEMKKLFQ